MSQKNRNTTGRVTTRRRKGPGSEAISGVDHGIVETGTQAVATSPAEPAMIAPDDGTPPADSVFEPASAHETVVVDQPAQGHVPSAAITSLETTASDAVTHEVVAADEAVITDRAADIPEPVQPAPAPVAAPTAPGLVAWTGCTPGMAAFQRSAFDLFRVGTEASFAFWGAVLDQKSTRK